MDTLLKTLWFYIALGLCSTACALSISSNHIYHISYCGCAISISSNHIYHISYLSFIFNYIALLNSQFVFHNKYVFLPPISDKNNNLINIMLSRWFIGKFVSNFVFIDKTMNQIFVQVFVHSTPRLLIWSYSDHFLCFTITLWSFFF